MSDFLLVFIALIIFFSVFRRYIFFAVMNAVSRKIFEQAQRQQRGYPPPPPGMENRHAGSVHVDDKKQNDRRNRDDGEYVDFEEVKD